MGNRISRRNFFGEMIRAGVRGLGDLAESGAAAETPDPTPTSALAGDLPPELLAMEAERLGLDPDKDKAEVARAVSEALDATRQP